MALRVRATRPLVKKTQADLLQGLANMADSGFKEFQEKWKRHFDYSRKELLNRRDELRMLWQVECCEHIALTAHTKRLRDKIWREFRRPADFVGICNHWLRLERQTFQVVTTKQGVDRIAPNDHCLPAVLAVACVRFRELMKVCGTCQAYFIAKRRDAKFCSAKCAKPAKREAKLRWWHRNRDRGRRPPS